MKVNSINHGYIFTKQSHPKIFIHKIILFIFSIVVLLLTYHVVSMVPLFICTFQISNEDIVNNYGDEIMLNEVSNDIIIQALNLSKIPYKIDSNGKIRIPYYARYNKTIFNSICFDVHHIYYQQPN